MGQFQDDKHSSRLLTTVAHYPPALVCVYIYIYILFFHNILRLVFFLSLTLANVLMQYSLTPNSLFNNSFKLGDKLQNYKGSGKDLDQGRTGE